jgi:hypothetical protein
VALSASGQPPGSTATFNPSSTSGTSTLTVSVSSGTPRGTYLITITGMSGSTVRSTSASLTVTRH